MKIIASKNKFLHKHDLQWSHDNGAVKHIGKYIMEIEQLCKCAALSLLLRTDIKSSWCI